MDLPEVELKRYMRGMSTVGTWNLFLKTSPRRLVRLIKAPDHWFAFEVDPPGEPLGRLRAPTRKELIEAVQIATALGR